MKTTANIHTRQIEVDVWCHGVHGTLGINEDALALRDDWTLIAFWAPPPPITDRDPGDEDVNP